MVSNGQITVRPYQAEDYEMVSEWFAARDQAAPQSELFPRLGCVVEVDGNPSAAAWVYMDNSVGVCFLEWLVTAPGQTVFESRKSVQHLLRFLSEHVREMDYSVMFASVFRDSMVKLAMNEGFVLGGGGYHHLYRVL